jgi:Flp pilus assembly protein TadD
VSERRARRVVVGLLLAAALPASAAGVDDLQARFTLRACAAAVREDSVRLCRQALELGLSPRRAAVAQRLLGRSLADLLRWEEPYLRKAVRSCPDQATYRVDLAVVLNALERHAEAAAEFHQALALDDHALDIRPAAQATYLASLREALWP